MPSHLLKLLVLLTVFSVAPAASGHQQAGTDGSDCPYARARAEAAAREESTTVTAMDRAPASGSLLGRSAVLSP